MGLPSLKSKLAFELEKDISDEPQVVYILSRVRKILESNNTGKEYKILKFYCDWALHIEIENIEPIKNMIEGVIANDDDAQLNFLLFKPFHIEFQKFLKAYNLPNKIYKTGISKNLFNRQLSQIYSDTPLIFKEIKKREVRWIDITKPGLPRKGYFKIE